LREEGAVEFMIRSVKEKPGIVTIISIAPASNIGEAIKRDPNFPKLCKNIVMMGGTYLA
jgi:purine nucleosidase